MNSTVKQTLALYMVESLMPPKSNAKNKDNISKWMYVLRLIIHILLLRPQPDGSQSSVRIIGMDLDLYIQYSFYIILYTG